MALYREAFKQRMLARLLPAEGTELGAVAVKRGLPDNPVRKLAYNVLI